jgi:hypothetical protein
VVEEVVEVVEVEAVAPAGVEGANGTVGGEEGLGQAAEEGSHGEIGLGPAKVGSGVNQANVAIGAGELVAAPQVAVDEAGRLLGHQVGQLGD